MMPACRIQGAPFAGSRQVAAVRPMVAAKAQTVNQSYSEDESGPRRTRDGQEKPEFKHFLPLPKPKHLVYIKPTVAVVADVADRSSVGLKMTAGGQQLERYVVEYFARSVK